MIRALIRRWANPRLLADNDRLVAELAAMTSARNGERAAAAKARGDLEREQQACQRAVDTSRRTYEAAKEAYLAQRQRLEGQIKELTRSLTEATSEIHRLRQRDGVIIIRDEATP